MSWSLFALTVLLAIALLLVPGFLLLWLLRVRDVRALLLAPGLSIGLLAVLTFLSIPVGHWGWAYVLTTIALLTIGLLVQNLRARKQHGSPSTTQPHSQARIAWFPTVFFALAGMAAFFCVYTPLVAKYWTGPGAVQSYGDAGFHYQGTLLVSLSGNADPFTALSAIYDPTNPTPVYYPSLWSALGALLSFDSVSAGLNALTLAVALVAWPLTLSALAVELTPKTSQLRVASAAFWAPFLGSFLSIYPARTMFRNAMDPFALSVLTLPVAITIIICANRNRHDRQTFWKWLLLLAVVFAGALASQPGTAVVIVFVLTAWLLIVLFRHVRGNRQTLSAYLSATAVTISAVAVLVGLSWVVTQSDYVQRLAKFQRSGVGLRAGFNHFLTGSARIPASESATQIPWALVIIAAALGALLLIKRFSGQLMILTGALLSVFYLASCYGETWVRDLTGVWYKDYNRLAIFIWCLILPLAAVFLAAAISWLSHSFRSQIAPTLLVSAGLAGLFGWSALLPNDNPESLGAQIRNGYSLDPGADTFLTPDSMRILELANDTFKEGDYLASAPGSGGQFIASQGQALSFFPLTTPRTPEQKIIGAELDQINDNPEVCAAIKAGNVRGLITTTSPVAPEQQEDLIGYQGILEVDTSNGFELIGESGPLQLWRITACD